MPRMPTHGEHPTTRQGPSQSILKRNENMFLQRGKHLVQELGHGLKYPGSLFQGCLELESQLHFPSRFLLTCTGGRGGGVAGDGSGTWVPTTLRNDLS